MGPWPTARDAGETGRGLFADYSESGFEHHHSRVDRLVIVDGTACCPHPGGPSSTDPVALDYHGAKYLLYPNSKISIHNPDDEKSPVHQYLSKCADEGGGIFDERFVEIISYDFKTKALQKEDDLMIIGDKSWGNNLKNILKYLVLRYYKG